jgi:LacI family transcriptional regulator
VQDGSLAVECSLFNHMSKLENRIPTIREVAKLAHVGLMTVSRVLNNHHSVRPSTRKKVESAIAQLGYQQNEAARMMKGQRAKTIGLIVPDLSDQFFAACAHTIQHIAREHGYMTLVISSERDADLEVEQAQLMSNRMLSGLLIVSSAKAGDERLRKLQSGGLAIVAFDRPLVGVVTDAVVVENRAGAEEATQHLIDHGHSRIVCVGYDEEMYPVHERLVGFKSQMFSKGLKPHTKLGLLTLDDVKVWVKNTMTSRDRPTAVFSLNHRTSSFLLRAFAEQHVRVPQDIALIGFDDFDLADIVSPPLTAVSQSPVELARRSITLLMERIQGGQTGSSFAPAKIVLPTRLIVRASCGPHKF